MIFFPIMFQPYLTTRALHNPLYLCKINRYWSEILHAPSNSHKHFTYTVSMKNNAWFQIYLGICVIWVVGPRLLGLGAGGARVGAIYIRNSYFIVLWKFHLIQASILLDNVDFGFGGGWVMIGKKFLRSGVPEDITFETVSEPVICRSLPIKYIFLNYS